MAVQHLDSVTQIMCHSKEFSKWYTINGQCSGCCKSCSSAETPVQRGI